jgi:SpoVK/Ycf46/Vps4 family AAA+-type ATPase
MKDVELDPSIIESLEDMTMLPLQQPEQFQYGLLAKARMAGALLLGALLFGPPGTGKTLLARAIAQRRSVHVLEVSGADVHQKYVGEAEKYVRAVFSLGRKLSPCVVFIDEADSIFCSRSSDMNQAYRNVINGFLREWDGLSTSTGADITMLVATNRPFDLDSAILRRLPRRLFLDLPSCRTRQKILEIMLRDEQLADSVDLPSIAIATDSFSGSDLKNLCIAAALSAVREGMRVSEGDESIVSTTKRTLTHDHFVKALAQTSPSTDADMVAKIQKFNKEFGRKPGRNRGLN